MENRFNLIDEAWIPVADVGRVSLAQLFARPDLRALGGTPLQKIAVMKLLLAIAQAAATPSDEAEWRALDGRGLAERCLGYLWRWYDRFYLYGERPFLQMPAIAAAAIQGYAALAPEVAAGNSTLLFQSQIPQRPDDGDKALLLLCQMGLALGGKKTDNTVVLSPGYRGKVNDKGKTASARPGPALGHRGLLHSFVLGETLLQTLHLNVWTGTDIFDAGSYPGGLGTPPWERMPRGEDCPVARALRHSLMGRLLPLSRFCLLREEGLHYSEGIVHPDYRAGGVDPSVALDRSGATLRAVWASPQRRPWRELPSLLGFLADGNARSDCPQLRIALSRLGGRAVRCALWSGGLRVSYRAGEQYVSAGDDYVESVLWLDGRTLDASGFDCLCRELDALGGLGHALYGGVAGFYQVQGADGRERAARACQLFWQLCERDVPSLLGHCGAGAQAQRQLLRRRFASHVHHAFDQLCSHDTARQLDAWVRRRPDMGAYQCAEAV
jgi:CRISPR system Cascade subunit CasA